MKITKFIPLMLVFALVLTSCQLFPAGTPPASGVPVTEAPAATVTGGVPYPGNSQVALPVVSNNSANAYPSPGAPVAQSAYPVPISANPTEAAAAAAYPGPTAQSLAPQTAPVYPELKDGAEIKWEQVQSIINSGQVVKVGQTHDLKVYITLKDGRTFATTEPAIDDILNLVKACGDLCKDIRVATQ